MKYRITITTNPDFYKSKDQHTEKQVASEEFEVEEDECGNLDLFQNVYDLIKEEIGELSYPASVRHAANTFSNKKFVEVDDIYGQPYFVRMG